MAYEGNRTKAVELYVGYIYNNPMVADNPKFIEYFHRMQKEFPVKSIDFVRSFEKGDLVSLHTHQVWPDNDEYITVSLN